MPFDDQGFESVLQYLGDYEGNQQWTSRWDLPLQLPSGQYAFRVRGSIGRDGAPYEILSDTFELSGNDALQAHKVERFEDILTLQLTYPNAPSNNDGESPFNSLQPTGSLLHLRHLGLNLSQPTPRLWKSLRYIIGGPIDGSVTLQLWSDISPLIEPRLPRYELSMTPVLSLCQISLITARNQAGRESTSNLDEVPCSKIQLNLSEYGITRSEGIWISVEDAYTNSALIQAPGLED